MIIQNPDKASGASPEEIQGLISTSHTEDIPSNTTTIDMQWSVPTGYTGYYYTIFTKASEYTQYTFDEISSEGITPIEDSFANYNHSGDDTSYYFHIAAVWTNEEEDEEYGPTSTFGPVIIDTTPPTGSVTISPNPSTTKNVILELSTDDAVKMYVSNVSPGEGSELDFVTSMPWELAEGEGLKTVYVQLKDVAGNTANISDSVTVTENTSPQVVKNSQQYTGEDTNISAGLSINDAEGGLLTISVSANNLSLTAGEAFSFTGVGLSANGNIYSVTATAGETIPVTFTLNGFSVESLIADVITITVSDSDNLSAAQSLNVYLKGDFDGDGIVELEDVETAFYISVGLNAASNLESYIIDAADDGEVNSQLDLETVFDRYIGF